MDTEFLKKSVGGPLQAALTAMVVEQPNEPVEFIGAFLLKYVAQEESKNAQAAKFAKAEELAAQQTAAAAAAAAAAAEAAVVKVDPKVEELKTELTTAAEVSPLFPRVLEAVKEGTKATGCYIGKKEVSTPAEEGAAAAPVITFFAGSEGSNMDGSFLKGVPEGTDPEEAKPEGASFDLFVGSEPPEPEPVMDPETGEEVPPDPDAPPPGLIYPSEIVVENVMRDPRMKFFGVPKIGAYACVPIRYKSCLHADGVGEAAPSEEEGASAGPVPNTIDCEMLMGLHKMGKAGEQFSAVELDMAKDMASAVAAALERSEKAIWDGEVAKISAEAEASAALGESIAASKAAEEAKAGEAVAAFPEDMPDFEKDHKTKVATYDGAKATLKTLTAQFTALGAKRLPLKSEPARLLTGLLYMMGYMKDSFVDTGTNKVNWEKMRACFEGEEFLTKVDSFNAEAADATYPKYARVEAMRALVAIEEMPTDPFYATAVLDFITTALDVRESAVEYGKAKAEADAAAAEEE